MNLESGDLFEDKEFQPEDKLNFQQQNIDNQQKFEIKTKNLTEIYQKSKTKNKLSVK